MGAFARSSTFGFSTAAAAARRVGIAIIDAVAAAAALVEHARAHYEPARGAGGAPRDGGVDTCHMGGPGEEGAPPLPRRPPPSSTKPSMPRSGTKIYPGALGELSCRIDFCSSSRSTIGNRFFGCFGAPNRQNTHSIFPIPIFANLRFLISLLRLPRWRLQTNGSRLRPVANARTPGVRVCEDPRTNRERLRTSSQTSVSVGVVNNVSLTVIIIGHCAGRSAIRRGAMLLIASARPSALGYTL